MAGNRPARERFEFSLDARQVAAVILGSLGALMLAFFLGHAIGQRVGDRPAAIARPAAAPAPADPLAVLDQAPRPVGGEAPAKLSYHDTLTSPRPPQEALPPVPKAAAPEPRMAPAPAAALPPSSGPVPAASSAVAPPKPAEAKAIEAKAADAKGAEPKAVAAEPPRAPAPQKPAAAPPPKSTPTVVAAVPAPRAGATASKGAWVVQVGSTQDRSEADRIAARFATRGARVVVAEVPGKGRWYRVRLGSFEARDAADRYLRDLERSTGAKGFVAPAN
jgi:cell division septation protein DedD